MEHGKGFQMGEQPVGFSRQGALELMTADMPIVEELNFEKGSQWRDLCQVRAGGLRLKGSDGDAGAHTFSSSPAREELLNVTAIVASSSTPPSAGCPARQYSHRCRAI